MCVQNLKSVALPVPEMIGDTKKISAVPVYAHAPFSPKVLHPVNVTAKFEVRSFTRSRVIRESPKIWAVPGYAHTLYSPKNPIGLYAYTVQD